MRPGLPSLGLVGCLLLLAGCGNPKSSVPGDGPRPKSPPSPYVIDQCQLEVNLEPASHRLEATATLAVALKNKPGKAPPGKLHLQLHRDLGIDAVSHNGASVSFRRLPDAPPTTSMPTSMPTTAEADDPPAPPPAIYELDWQAAPGRPGTLVIRYGGTLFQDVQAGEKPGEIHNFQMRAHVGEEGIYLGEGGAWYPQLPDTDEDNPTEEYPLTRFELTATEPPGMVLVCCGNRDGAKIDLPRGPRTTWRMPFPAGGLALVGGPHQVFQRQVDDVLVSVHVGQDHASFAPGLLDAVESYLRLYEPLLGEYPYVEFTVFENFFSSGFGFPGFTALSSAVIAMGPMGLMPGYLDHELLHNWWGNGVFLSALDGNWCECLTSYCANYMRPVLEGRQDKARAQRRDICYGLSRMASEDDKPLATFGQKNGAGRFIGYQKGSMVFAMLADKIGQDAVWRSLRRLRDERLGKPTTWKDIQAVIERESRQPLAAFFDTWVRAGGVPQITIDGAGYDQRARRLSMTLTQTGPRVYDVTLPVRLVFDDRIQDEPISINRSTQVALIKSLISPNFVELDPDFHVMRRVPIENVMPTISGIGKSKNLLIVRSEDDGPAYDKLANQIKERYEKAKDTSAREIKDVELKPEDLQKGHVLLLGKACLAPVVAAVLQDCSLKFVDGGFTVDNQRFVQPTDEVLCCLRNEQDSGGVICLYCGNSAPDVKKAGVATFYGNSLVVFENGTATQRQDFEKTDRVKVEDPG